MKPPQPITKAYQFLKNRPKIAIPTLVIITILTIFLILMPSFKKTDLTLVSISPEPPTFESLWSAHKITLTFSHPLNQETINYSIKPETNTRLIFDPQNPSQFSILTLDGLKSDTAYSFTINKDLSTPDRQSLNKNLKFKLTRTQPDTTKIFQNLAP